MCYMPQSDGNWRMLLFEDQLTFSDDRGQANIQKLVGMKHRITTVSSKEFYLYRFNMEKVL